MKIIIPMSGFGERFRRAGYPVPKPLIEVDGKPIIAHVIDMFPGEHDFVFICNEEHLNNPAYQMQAILNKYCPTGKVVSIKSHKLGPVYAVTQVFDLIDENEPVIVNYCDFTCDWNYAHFKEWLKQTPCDGCVPAYRGFHPHSLGSTYYAYIKQTGLWMEDIQEKQPFTTTPMQEFASSGTYYFAKGNLVKHYFQETIARNLQVNSEYYVSLVYKPMLADGLPIAVYELPHFMQWGTPDDLQEYQYWSRAFAALTKTLQHQQAAQQGTLLLPMVGLGSRYAKEGFNLPKPLIPVAGLPMAVQAVADLPDMQNKVFILRRDLPDLEMLKSSLAEYFPTAEFKILPGLTEGQACTCLEAAVELEPNAPIVIGACDNGIVYDAAKYQALMADPEVDVIVWTARGYFNAKRKPEMYGWVQLQSNESTAIQSVSVKKPLANPAQDPIVIGAFTFKRAKDFIKATEHMMAADRRVNNEFYVDECINDAIALGLKCHVFDIDYYLSWGTPDELRTFEYWQACFHNWPHHPYRLELDKNVLPERIKDLEQKYQIQLSKLPELK